MGGIFSKYFMEKTPSKKLRALYIVMPFFLLLFGLGLFNWGIRPSPLAVLPPATAVALAPTSQPEATIDQLPTATPKPMVTPVPTAAPYVPPIFPNEAVIDILGPPANTFWATTEGLVMYWNWPVPLTDDQFFEVYLVSNQSAALLGRVEEPNMGSSYRLTAVWPQGLAPGDYQWQIRLQSTFSASPLRVSEERPLTLLTP